MMNDIRLVQGIPTFINTSLPWIDGCSRDCLVTVTFEDGAERIVQVITTELDIIKAMQVGSQFKPTAWVQRIFGKIAKCEVNVIGHVNGDTTIARENFQKHPLAIWHKNPKSVVNFS